MKRSKVNAVAVVGRFPDDDVEETDNYRQGMVMKIPQLLHFLLFFIQVIPVPLLLLVNFCELLSILFGVSFYELDHKCYDSAVCI